MRLSKLFLPTLREAPGDADTISAKLMFRSGMIRKLASGIYEWLPLGLKVLKKVEQIIREEMNAINGQEVWLPLLLPKELWEETGRWALYGKELFRLKDRKESDFCLGPTHEEVITDLVRKDVRSYRQLPLMLYQFGTKFRDEIRPRFGIMRAREFYMKDAYSFHTDEKDLENYYQQAYNAYKKICDRCGFKYRAVEASSGLIGGSFSHEFMVLAETGEEEIAWCGCGYGANINKAECKKEEASGSEKKGTLKEVHTPNKRSVEEVAEYLKADPKKFIKSLIYEADGKPVMVLVRGDYDVNETKVMTILDCADLKLAGNEVVKNFSGAEIGFAGPVNLKKKIKILADFSVENIINGISGANKTDCHYAGINIGRDFTADIAADLRKIKHGDKCNHCGKVLEFSKGIEIGHAFKLGQKYSKSMKAAYLNEKGEENLMVMGCYGIGVSRIVAATIEQSNDENGIIWPVPLAPYKVIIVTINSADEQTRKKSEEIYEKLNSSGIETLFDDRDERAGIKFKDADLIGIPYRITVSEKNLKDNKVELKARWQKNTETQFIPIENVLSEIKKALKID
ncbi:MAG: proline--tRNA ligase [Elusimicrobia bacterium]|nr:proline--tRNA ligase [Elusimicrobiota bacterium]